MVWGVFALENKPMDKYRAPERQEDMICRKAS